MANGGCLLVVVCVLVTWFWWFGCLVTRLFRFVGGLSGLLLWLLLFG